MGDDREEIARIIDPDAFRAVEGAYNWALRHTRRAGGWWFAPACERGLIRIQEAYAKADAILARQGPGPGEAVADGWVMVPRDDDSRQFSDSALPIEMIDAGVAVFDRVHLDLAGHNGKDVPDWDDGMVAVAVYRAMIAATPTREA